MDIGADSKSNESIKIISNIRGDFMYQKKNKLGLSKKMLYADYAIAIILIMVVFIFACINGIYIMTTVNELVEMGADISVIDISAPFDLDILGVILGIWIAQLGLSTGAYYVLVKSERKIELPIKLLNDLPEDIKEQVDVTQIITTVLSSTEN